MTYGCATLGRAQSQPPVPNSEVFLAPFHEGEKTTYRFALLVVQRQGVKVGNPVNITSHAASDSHPSFLPDSTAVSFVSSRNGRPMAYRYDMATKGVALLGTATGALAPDAGSREVGVTPVGSKVMGRKSRLVIWQPAEDHWINIANVRKAGVDDITEVAVSPDGRWIAFAATVTRR